MWKATKAVGVAQASTGSGYSKQIFIVARYRPAGNLTGKFRENVGEKRSSYRYILHKIYLLAICFIHFNLRFNVAKLDVERIDPELLIR